MLKATFDLCEFNRKTGLYKLQLTHSKNVRVKNSRSFENDPIWVKTASFDPVMDHIRKSRSREKRVKRKTKMAVHGKSRRQTKAYFSQIFYVQCKIWDVKCEQKKVNISPLCFPQEIWVAEPS